MIAGAAMNIIHMIDRAAADAVHSRTSYSKATPSGSFSSNHFSAASTFANTLTLVDVADLFACIDVTNTVLIGPSSASAGPNDDLYARDQTPARRGGSKLRIPRCRATT